MSGQLLRSDCGRSSLDSGLAVALGRLPAVFASSAGLGDIAVGLTAPVIARRLAQGDRSGATLPLALIPTAAVPLAMGLHVTSLIRLRTA